MTADPNPTTTYLDDQAGRWFFRAKVRSVGNGAMAWCAETDALGDSPLESNLLGCDVHFAFASSPQEAISKLKTEVLS